MTDIQKLIDAISATGLPPPTEQKLVAAINNKKPLRWWTSGNKFERNGWCCVRDISGILSANFGCWRSGVKDYWSSKTRNDLSEVDWKVHIKLREEYFEKLQDDADLKAAEAAFKAQERWENAKPAGGSEPYLIAKNVNPYGLRLEGENLLISIYNLAEKGITSLQTISPNGEKRFLSDGKVQGGFYQIGDESDEVVICEGFATGASIYEATGLVVAVAFHAGNLLPVTIAIRDKFPNKKLIIAADDDWKKDPNTGLVKAKETALEVGGYLTIPTFPKNRGDKDTDFNDLARLSGIDTVRLQIESASLVDPDAWEEPLSLNAKIDAEDYPTSALPDEIRLAVEEVANFTKAPIPLVASSALTAISLALQAHLDVRRAEKLQSPSSAYFLTIADSGDRKTTCDSYFMQAIRKYEAEQAELAKPDLRKYAADMQTWEAKRSGLKDKIRELAKKQNSTLTIENALHDLEFSKPLAPRVPKILHTDITPEKLGHFLANEWPSGGVVSNEAGAVFGSHGMGKDSIMRNLALLNTLWDGGEISSERKSTEGYTVRGARFTMGLQVQEATLREFFSKSGTLARGTGFLARFLISWPKSNMGKRLFTEAPVAWPYLEAFNRRLTVILNAAPPLNNGVLTPHLMGLSDAAKQSWIQYHDMVEIELNTSGDYFDIRDVAAKSADNAARLAGLFERFANSDGGAIGQDSFQRAAKVAAWHLEEAKRFFGEIVLPQVVNDAVRLESWLIDFKHKEELSTRYAQRHGPFRDKKQLDPALAELESLGRIKLIQEGKRKLIKVNPMLLK